MTKLSVNINKIATIRNARGGNIPNVQQAAIDCEQYGAEGITVHPRPDQRHITYNDVELLRPFITTEFNIEGYPTPEFIELVLKNIPHQVTLVPDEPGQLTSDHGWDTIKHKAFLKSIIKQFKQAGIRTSIFVDPDIEMVKHALDAGTDRIELYTESYASGFQSNKSAAIAPFVEAAEVANSIGLGMNAGHDLNLDNLAYFIQEIPSIMEVSIGHALISDALYFGLNNTIQMYRKQLIHH